MNKVTLFIYPPAEPWIIIFDLHEIREILITVFYTVTTGVMIKLVIYLVYSIRYIDTEKFLTALFRAILQYFGYKLFPYPSQHSSQPIDDHD